MVVVVLHMAMKTLYLGKEDDSGNKTKKKN